MRKDMSGKTVVITGANTGIGKATAAILADLGADVIMACRDSARGQAALEELAIKPGRQLDLMKIDLSDLKSVSRFAEKFAKRYQTLDVLINNAGIVGQKRMLTKGGCEQQFQTNYLGHFLLTLRLSPHIESAPQGRVIMLSSIAHHWTDVHFHDIHLEQHYNRMLAYGHSKLCCLLFCRHQAQQWHHRGASATINAAHPGLVASDIIVDRRNNAYKWAAVLSRAVLIPPASGAKTSVFLASDDSLDHVSGEYFVRCKIARSSPASKSMEDAARLYDLSLALCQSYL